MNQNRPTTCASKADCRVPGTESWLSEHSDHWCIRRLFNRNLLHSPLNELFYSAGLPKCYGVHDEQRTHPVSHPDQSPPFSSCRTLSVSLSNPGQQFHMYNHLCNPIKRPGKLLNYIANDFPLICVHQSRCSRRWAAPYLQLHATHIHCKVLVASIFLSRLPPPFSGVSSK